MLKTSSANPDAGWIIPAVLGALALVSLIAYGLTSNATTLAKQSKDYRDDRRAEIRSFVVSSMDCFKTVASTSMRTCSNKQIALYHNKGVMLAATKGSVLPAFKLTARAVCVTPGTIDIEFKAPKGNTWSKAFAIQCPYP